MNAALRDALKPSQGFKDPTTLPLVPQHGAIPSGALNPTTGAAQVPTWNDQGVVTNGATLSGGTLVANGACPINPCPRGDVTLYTIGVEKKAKTCWDVCKDQKRADDIRAAELRAAAYNWLKCQGVAARVTKPTKRRRGGSTYSGYSRSSGRSSVSSMY